MILKTSVKPWRACNRRLSFAGEGLAAQAKSALKSCRLCGDLGARPLAVAMSAKVLT